MTGPERDAKYGAFRVAYRSDSGLILRVGIGHHWDELTATRVQIAMGDVFDDAWVEHQNPNTKEWRRW